MEHPPQYSVRDILWAPARALQAKQIAFMTGAILAALAVHVVFVYAAHLVQGESLQSIYWAYGFFNFFGSQFDNGFSSFLNAAGLLVSLLVIMLGFFGVAAVNIESIRGNRFFSLRDTIGFTLRRIKQIAMSEGAIILFIGFIILLFYLLGLLTRIPVIGEWIFTVFFVLPNFVVAIFTIFIIFVLILSVMLLPAVAAAEREGESFNVILETFSTIVRQPFRWIAYTVYSAVASKIATFVYAYFCFRAVQFMVVTSGLGAGDKTRQLVLNGLAHLPVRSELVPLVTNIFPSVKFGFDIPYGVPGAGGLTEYLMAIMLFIIFVSIVGYGLAILAAGQARAYVVLRYMKDGYKIPEEKSLFAGIER
ncbi:MAG: hypothetical protein WAU88_00490 [Candidatus Zixiibacteriota bacterium]|jgi:hypothetical protein